MSLSLITDRSFFIPLFVIIMIFAIVLFNTAWLNDDAYITFRTVDNFVNGYGLTWNVSERVETYSNPLWMFLVSIPYFFTNEIYYTSIILSIVVTVIVILIFAFKIPKTVLGAILGITIFIFSKPFIDYSTSGLENPLTHLILVIFLMVYIKSMKRFNLKTLFLLSIITAFGAINRLDTIVFFLPCLVFAFLKLPKIKGVYIITIGLLPAIIWKGLALFYYGFPFPNTAYAKVLNTGISKTEYVQHGFLYFENLVVWHPVTFFIIMVGMAVPFIIKEKRLIPITLGIVLYLIFILQSGGDFMSGRLFTAPLLVAVILLSQCNFTVFRRIPLVALFAIVIVVGVIAPNSSLFSDENYFSFQNIKLKVSDERGFYYPDTGLLNNLHIVEAPYHRWGEGGLKVKETNTTPHVTYAIGMFGFHAGPKIHIIDPFALGDPLLSKLPLTFDYWTFDFISTTTIGHLGDNIKGGWRSGHIARTLPPGYFETLQSGENVIEDKCLAKYYDKLSILTRGDLFDANRIQEIWKMNTGQYDYLLEPYIHGQENFQNYDC